MNKIVINRTRIMCLILISLDRIKFLIIVITLLSKIMKWFILEKKKKSHDVIAETLFFLIVFLYIYRDSFRANRKNPVKRHFIADISH